MTAAVVLVYHVVSRLAYVLGVGFALTRQERSQWFTRRYGAEHGFRRFRRGASLVMANDAVSFVLLCLVTRHTLRVDLPPPAVFAAGVALVLVGVVVKLWAAARLGSDAYYWHNFFIPGEVIAPDPPGPYRFLKNPMYTVGYLPTYGLALVAGSLPGLVAAAFDQAAILAFNRWVEQPHLARLTRAASRRSPAAP